MKKPMPNAALAEMLARDDDGEWRGSSGLFMSPAELEPTPPPEPRWTPPPPPWSELAVEEVDPDELEPEAEPQPLPPVEIPPPPWKRADDGQRGES